MRISFTSFNGLDNSEISLSSDKIVFCIFVILFNSLLNRFLYTFKITKNPVITAMRKQLMIVKSALGKTLLRKSFENCEVALLYPRTHFSDELPISS